MGDRLGSFFPGGHHSQNGFLTVSCYDISAVFIIQFRERVCFCLIYGKVIAG